MKSRRAQFFIITTVLIAIIFFSISGSLSNYSKINMNRFRESQAPFVFHNIESKISENLQERAGSSISKKEEEMKAFIEEMASERGYKLDLNISSCVNISLKSANYEIYKEFCSKSGVFGDGSDGSVTLTSKRNINSEDLNGDGEIDSPVYSVSDVGSNYVTTSSPVSGINSGDEIMLINLQGSSSSYDKVGNHEFLRVSSVSGDHIEIESSISKLYGNPSDQDIVVQRVPNYEDLTIDGGEITSSDWDGNKGGILAFRVSGALEFKNGGKIDISGKGYRGGTCGSCSDDWDGGRGEGINGWEMGGGNKDYPDEVSLNNINGGGGNHVDNNDGGDPGAGGGYGTSGETVSDSQSSYDSTGGAVVGNNKLTKIFFGGGGGAGADNDNYAPRPENSDGGGIVFIAAKNIQNAIVYSEGEDGKGDGDCCGGASGGGAGGSIYIKSNDIDINTIDATGGIWSGTTGGEEGGKGGEGRIRLDYNQVSGISNVDPSAGYVDNP